MFENFNAEMLSKKEFYKRIKKIKSKDFLRYDVMSSTNNINNIFQLGRILIAVTWHSSKFELSPISTNSK